MASTLSIVIGVVKCNVALLLYAEQNRNLMVEHGTHGKPRVDKAERAVFALAEDSSSGIRVVDGAERTDRKSERSKSWREA
jgi:hypothetical protein